MYKQNVILQAAVNLRRGVVRSFVLVYSIIAPRFVLVNLFRADFSYFSAFCINAQMEVLVLVYFL